MEQTKEVLARDIAERDDVTEGLVCVLRAMESCQLFKLGRNHSHLVWDNAHPATALTHRRADQQPQGTRYLYARD